VDGEIVDHILMHCDVAHELWFFVLALFRFRWVMPNSLFGLRGREGK